MGGHIGNAAETVSPTTSMLKDGQIYCENYERSIPDPTGLLKSYAAPMIYFKPWLVISGGFDPVIGNATADSLRLDTEGEFS